MKLAFEDLRYANVQRNKEWDPVNMITPSFAAIELAGEVGELLNVIKKLERERLGIPGSRANFFDLAEEMADVAICLDLLAMRYSIDLGEAVRFKFNKTSHKMNLLTEL